MRKQVNFSAYLCINLYRSGLMEVVSREVLLYWVIDWFYIRGT